MCRVLITSVPLSSGRQMIIHNPSKDLLMSHCPYLCLMVHLRCQVAGKASVYQETMLPAMLSWLYCKNKWSSFDELLQWMLEYSSWETTGICQTFMHSFYSLVFMIFIAYMCRKGIVTFSLLWTFEVLIQSQQESKQ